MSASEPERMFLRPAEAGALAGLSTRAIYRAVQRGELEAVRLCSRLRIPRAAFDEWIEHGRVQPHEPLRPAQPATFRGSPGRGGFRALLAALPDRSHGS